MTVEVGSKIDGWCGRCKLMLRHTVEVVKLEKITRAHCNTCGSKHAHRARAPGSKATTSQEGRYEQLLRGRTAASSTQYSTSGSFVVGELISHASFGLGVVTATRDSVKIDILFADGAKVLQQGS